MTTIVRVATPIDVDAVMSIEKAAFDHPWPRSAFDKEFDNDIAVFKVLEDKSGVAGYYDLWVCAGEAHLLNIAVAADKRGSGYGHRLLADAVDVARNGGAAKIFLEVRRGNEPAIALYRKYGFMRVSRRRRYYENGEDADIMVLELE